MYIEEYGKENEKIIVFLHGANFVHAFGRQYSLSNEFHIIVPHIMGFGKEADRVFNTDMCISELAEFIHSLGQRVVLIGFSLGAQLAFRLVSEYEELFRAAIIVSPWLIKTEPMLSYILKMNQKQLSSLKKKPLCSFTGLMNGLPSEQRKEFVEHMQHVKAETIQNIVYNGITFDSVPSFAEVSVPVLALAGGKEQDVIHDSVRKMAELNLNCTCEIWEKAGHNIPPLFAKQFNNAITAMIKDL